VTNKLLTVAIPTYRRAAELDRQLAWLARDVASVAGDCAVIISDNASPDDTPDVCQRWRKALASQGVEWLLNRNPENVGPLPNIARCIELSTSRFTWVIGDDDEIPEEKLEWIVERLRADPKLASIVLNFQGVGKSRYERCFNFPSDQLGEGRRVMSECLRQAYWGLAFMTAQIYRTEYAQAALRAWPEGRTNYEYQIFITAYAGLQGRVLVTRDPHVKYVTGDNVYETNKRVGLTTYADSLQVFLNLRRVGYESKLCRWLACHHLWALKRRFAGRALQNNPLLTLATISRLAVYLARIVIPSTGLRESAPNVIRPMAQPRWTLSRNPLVFRVHRVAPISSSRSNKSPTKTVECSRLWIRRISDRPPSHNKRLEPRSHEATKHCISPLPGLGERVRVRGRTHQRVDHIDPRDTSYRDSAIRQAHQ
jgi:glycosyltransferase involved in cell wall biosynthesis